MAQETQCLYEFGAYRLDPAQQLLFEGTRQVSLTLKAFQTLLALVEAEGRVLSKDELLHKVWPDTFVEEATLAQNISTLRKQLHDGSDTTQYIETVPKRGYRFVAAVRVEAVPALGVKSNGRDAGSIGSQANHVRSSLEAGWVPKRAVTRRSLYAIGAAVIAIAAFAGWRFWSGKSVEEVDKPKSVLATSSHRVMLVVLPVQNLTGDAQQDYFADGLTEEVIAELGSVNPERLGVIARTSAMAYKHTSKTIREITQELGADYVLETSVREGSNKLRFTAQLIRAQDQTHVWAHNYNRPLADVLTLQDELARTVAEEVRVELPQGGSARVAAARSIQPEAHDAYAHGLYHWNQRTAPEVKTAIAYFQRAIAKDPAFAPAYAGLADCYVLLTMMRDAPPAEMMPKAKAAVLKALALDDSLANAHTVLGEIAEVSDWDWPAAEKAYRRAIELDPNDSNAHHQYAIFLSVTGRFPEALAEIRRAQAVDPVSPVMFSSMGWIYVRSHFPDRAIVECQKSLELDARYVRGHLCIGEAYEEKHDLQRAAEEFLAGKVLTGLEPHQLNELQQGLRQSGYAGYFRARLKQLTSGKSYVSPYDLADLALRVGDKEQALKWLEAAYAEHSPYLVFLLIEPRMDSLRPDKRFQDLIRRIGLGSIRITRIEETTT